MYLCNEIKENIIKYLDGRSIFTMTCVDKQWNDILTDERIWKRLIKIHKIYTNYNNLRAVYISNLEYRCIQCYENTMNECDITGHIVCKNCIRTNTIYRRITKTMAKKEYFLDEYKDLKYLRRLTCTNPHYKRGPPMTLYLYNDILNIAYDKYGGKNNFEKLKQKKEEKREKRERNYYRNRLWY